MWCDATPELEPLSIEKESTVKEGKKRKTEQSVKKYIVKLNRLTGGTPAIGRVDEKGKLFDLVSEDQVAECIKMCKSKSELVELLKKHFPGDEVQVNSDYFKEFVEYFKAKS